MARHVGARSVAARVKRRRRLARARAHAFCVGRGRYLGGIDFEGLDRDAVHRLFVGLAILGSHVELPRGHFGHFGPWCQTVPQKDHNRGGSKTARENKKKTWDFPGQKTPAGAFVFGEVAVRHEKVFIGASRDSCKALSQPPLTHRCASHKRALPKKEKIAPCRFEDSPFCCPLPRLPSP
jgi:hypothetical protein